MASDTKINIACCFVCFFPAVGKLCLMMYLKKASISVSQLHKIQHYPLKEQVIGRKMPNERIFFAEGRGQLREKE